jgi:hypothetical protein
VGEPYSFAFLKDNTLFRPFAIPAATEFKALIPNPNVAQKHYISYSKRKLHNGWF